MQNLHMHIHASKDTKDNDQKFVLQFVAYLEKFTTNQQSYSRESLLKQQWFSPDEYHNLREVYYGQQALSLTLKQKIQAKMV